MAMLETVCAADLRARSEAERVDLRDPGLDLGGFGRRFRRLMVGMARSGMERKSEFSVALRRSG